MAQADIITDGTMGEQVTLSGTRLDISESLGTQIGHNLYHSFTQFDIAEGQTALFTGSEQITNVIGRITGGTISSIEGTINSDIPHVYLLNTSGFMFGKNVKLNVPTSFHLSTSDTLKLGNDGHFSVDLTKESILTTSKPEAYGFLPKSGIIHLENAKVESNENNQIFFNTDKFSMHQSNLFIPSGHLNIEANQIEIATLSNIYMDRDSNVNQRKGSMQKSGSISINTNDMTLRDRSSINSWNSSSTEKGGNIKIEASKLQIIQSSIDTKSLISARGDAGDIYIKTEELYIDNKAYIGSETFSLNGGQSSQIDIKADDSIEILNGSRIYTLVGDNEALIGATGNGGDINISSPLLKISDSGLEDPNAFKSRISTGTFVQTTGNSGNIDLDVSELSLTDGAFIATLSNGTGRSGNLNLVANQINLRNKSAIYAQKGILAGDAGSIFINTNNLFLEWNSEIRTNSEEAQAGRIDIQANDTVSILSDSLINSESLQGIAGDIEIQTDNLLLEGSQINTDAFMGTGGKIKIQADKLLLSEKGEITTSSVRENGGNIDIVKTALFVFKDNSILRTSSNAGDGGDITITSNYFIELGENTIDNSSLKGLSGNLEITSISFELNIETLSLSSDFDYFYVMLQCEDNPSILQPSTLTIKHRLLPLQPPNLMPVPL